MNAVAVINLPDGKLTGYFPTGWYPTAVIAAPTAKRCSSRKQRAFQVRNPNGSTVGPDGNLGQYIENIIEGTISAVPIPSDDDLKKQTAQVITNNRITPTLNRDARALLGSPGIQHVIYIIKENRTYDNVLGDLAGGNGDKSLCLSPAK